jgi:hypothetical protein
MDIGLIWANSERLYFCNQDWTGQISLIQLNKFDFARASFHQHPIREERRRPKLIASTVTASASISNFRLVLQPVQSAVMIAKRWRVTPSAPTRPTVR